VSRSIHTTRSTVERLRRERFGDRAVKREAVAEAERQLEAKRAVKRHPRPGDRRTPAPVDARTVPVLVETLGRGLVHPVDEKDVRALLRRLPRGTLDGLTEIRLCTGARRLRARRRDRDDVDALGRPVDERLPGVFGPLILGTYFVARRRIEIYAYATTDADALALVRPLVRAWGLATLAHEIAHHDDHTSRAKRDRWRADREATEEHHAERVEHAWGMAHVLPIIERLHAREVAALSAWIGETLGVPLPFAQLLGDPRTTQRNELHTLRWSVYEALATLLRGGADREGLRVEAARDLFVADAYELALAVLDGVLAVDRSHVGARALRADVLESAGREGEALQLAEEVLRDAPNDARAIAVTLRGFTWAGRWEALFALSMRTLALPDAKRYERTARSLAMLRALLELRRWRELDQATAAFLAESPSRFNRVRATGLQALSLLRRGEARAALDAADDELATRSQRTHWHTLFDAVRFEALLTLGRASEAKALAPAVRTALEGMRFGEWIRRLEALAAWGPLPTGERDR
jgi:hypothetical protein